MNAGISKENQKREAKRQVNPIDTKLLRKCHKTEWVRAYSPKLSRLRRQGRNYKCRKTL